MLRRLRRHLGLGAAAALLTVAATPVAQAAPGEPVASFGSSGAVQAPFPDREHAAGRTAFGGGGGIRVFGSVFDDPTSGGGFSVPVSLGFAADGAAVPGFGGVASAISGRVTDVARRTGGGFAATVGETPGGIDSVGLPQDARVVGFGADGRPDPGFSGDGVVDLGAIGPPEAVLDAPDGTTRAIGVHQTPGTPATGAAIEDGIYLVRLTSAGAVLGSSTVPVAPGARGIDLAGAARLPGGGLMVAARVPAGLALARFGADGRPDAAFGPGGLRIVTGEPAADRMRLEGMDVDAAGRVLVAGSVLSGRPDALLLRISSGGTVDRSLRPPDFLGALGESGLTAVRVDRAGRLLVLGEGGSLVRLRADGRPDPRFGAAGVAIRAARGPNVAGGLALAGARAFVTGEGRGDGGPAALAVTQIRLGGRGVAAPRRGAVLDAVARGGRVLVRGPLSRRALRLRHRIALPLAQPRSAPDTGPRIAARVDADHGRVRLLGAGGRADLRHGTVTLRRARRSIALLDLAAPRCGRVQITRLTLHGRFTVDTGARTVRTRRAPVAVTVRRRCRGRVHVDVTRLRAKRSGRGHR